MRADWLKIRHEYITTAISQRELCKKYGVSRSAFYKKCQAEKWNDKREKHQSQTEAKVIQIAQNKAIDQTARLYEATDKLLDKVFQLLDLDDALAPRDLKSLSSTLMDVKMLRAKDDSEVAALENQITVKWIGNEWDGDVNA